VDGSIVHQENKYFDVIGLDIFIENRESAAWSQPMILPKGEGICCFFAKKIDGVFFLLVQLKDEIGSFDGVEMAPTIQSSVENLENSPFYSIYQDHKSNNERILMDILQSEEGGRFYQEQNRNQIIDVTGINLPENSNYIWMTINQIKNFLQYNNYVNIQTRSIISSLPL
jgi:oxidase EvaA